MEFSHSQSNIDSVDSATFPDTGNCALSAGDVDVTGSCRTSTKSRRKREPLEPLIVDALRSAPAKRLILADIYRYIETHSATYRTAAASLPSSSGDEEGRPARTKEAAWKINVRHILSVRRDVFPLTTVKDGKRRGRYHALDELQYASRLAANAVRSGITNNVDDGFTAASRPSTSSEPAKRRRQPRIHGEVDRSIRPQTHVSCFIGFLETNS